MFAAADVEDFDFVSMWYVAIVAGNEPHQWLRRPDGLAVGREVDGPVHSAASAFAHFSPSQTNPLARMNSSSTAAFAASSGVGRNSFHDCFRIHVSAIGTNLGSWSPGMDAATLRCMIRKL